MHLSVQVSQSTQSDFKLMVADQLLSWDRMSMSHRQTHLSISPFLVIWDAQSVSHKDQNRITHSLPDTVYDWFSVSTSHFADDMPNKSKMSDAGKFAGGSKQRFKDLGHHDVSTTPSPCHDTRMTVAFDNNMAEVHSHCDLHHSGNVFSSIPASGSTWTPTNSHTGQNMNIPAFIPVWHDSGQWGWLFEGITPRSSMISTESIKDLDYRTSLRLIASKLPVHLQGAGCGLQTRSYTRRVSLVSSVSWWNSLNARTISG